MQTENTPCCPNSSFWKKTTHLLFLYRPPPPPATPEHHKIFHMASDTRHRPHTFQLRPVITFDDAVRVLAVLGGASPLLNSRGRWEERGEWWRERGRQGPGEEEKQRVRGTRIKTKTLLEEPEEKGRTRRRDQRRTLNDKEGRNVGKKPPVRKEVVTTGTGREREGRGMSAEEEEADGVRSCSCLPLVLASLAARSLSVQSARVITHRSSMDKTLAWLLCCRLHGLHYPPAHTHTWEKNKAWKDLILISIWYWTRAADSDLRCLKPSSGRDVLTPQECRRSAGWSGAWRRCAPEHTHTHWCSRIIRFA